MSTSTVSLFSPLSLPNGAVIPNRIAKAAMEENMSEPGQLPGQALFALYRHWAQGGAGLIITGNVMIDGRALTGPGGVVLEKATSLERFKTWALAAREGGAQVWMQINHPGRQVRAEQGGNAWAPSDVALDLGKHSKLFVTPVAMTSVQIAEVIQRFVDTSLQAQHAGFTGVQLHAAHGYLMSQFLSPLSNRRDDEWGGSLENRARLLLEVVKAVRAAVAPEFCVSVKLNSADFQRGGFSETDAKQVLLWLNELNVDLVELSGGSYESPAMQGRVADGRTLAREAYFLEFAKELASVAKMPVMTTGGIRRREVAEQVLAAGVDMVGIATGLALVPDLPKRWQRGENAVANPQAVEWKDKALGSLAKMAITKRHLRRLGQSDAQGAAPDFPALMTFVHDQWRTKKLTQRYRAWLSTRA